MRKWAWAKGVSFIIASILATQLSLVSLARAESGLRSVEGMVSFLAFLRRTQRDLYQDFVVRYNAIQFLGTAQEAVDRVEFNRESIDGFKVSIFDSLQSTASEGVFKKNLFDKELSAFLSTSPVVSEELSDILWRSVGVLSQLDGLRAGLMNSKSLPGARDIFKLQGAAQLEALENALKDVNRVDGLDPRRLGISQDFFSGLEVVSRFEAIQSAQRNIPMLLPFAIVAESRGVKGSVKSVGELIAGFSEGQLKSEYSPESLHKSFAALAAKAPATITTIASSAKVQRLFKDALGAFRSKVFAQDVKSASPSYILTRAHPYELWLRGSVGDCSTFNNFPISLARSEAIYWVGKDDPSAKGYLQTTHVKVDGQSAIYLNTLSGAQISRADARSILAGFFEFVSKQSPDGAKKIVLPVPQLIQYIINFPEIGAVFRELIAHGRPVKIEYLDAADRKKLAPFTEDYLDLPETNQYGMEVPLDVFHSHFKESLVRSESKKIAVNTSALFPKISKEEAFVVALELRNRESKDAELDQILSSYKIDHKSFESVWETLSNVRNLPVGQLHEAVKKSLQIAGVNINWEYFVKSPLLLRGHFAAPDALGERYLKLSELYLETYLLSYTDLKYVFLTLKPHLSKLVEFPYFRTIVNSLFKKNAREMGRLLDYYELEQRSAYRTLINLFRAGMPMAPFHKEIEKLKAPIEETQETQRRRDGVFVRRMTFLGAIHEFPASYYDTIMRHLEVMAPRGNVWEQDDETDTKTKGKDGAAATAGVFLDVDDVRSVCHYVAEFMNSGKMQTAQIKRFENFLVGSEFGLTFTKELGLYKVLKLDIQRIMDVLQQHGKFDWAAYLIHKDWWAGHPRASKWMQQVWEHGGAVGPELFILGLRGNTKWLNVYLADSMVDGLMQVARYNIIDEKSVMKIILEKPNLLKPIRLQWLAEATTLELAQMLLEAIDARWPVGKATWLVSRLVSRFPELHSVAQQALRRSTLSSAEKCSAIAAPKLPEAGGF